MKCQKPIEQMTLEQVRTRWPRVTAHVIAESLGYATPDCAASIVRDAFLEQKNWCEWVDACYRGDARRVLAASIRNRRYHQGYMAEYRLALQIVRHPQAAHPCPALASRPARHVR